MTRITAIEEFELERVRRRMLGNHEQRLSTDPEPHWACPDCGQPCRCIGAARLLKHDRCGLWET